jgi:hypothetical protein
MHGAAMVAWNSRWTAIEIKVGFFVEIDLLPMAHFVNKVAVPERDVTTTGPV